ncbi:hypothetical protein KY341_03920 [Candidatus Woesearchaeota archaeon]|nr:hypothetical protein [Candidatus Woesearchaeota archaeon]
MVKTPEYSLNVDKRKDILGLFNELSSMGSLVMEKGNYPRTNYEKVYHIGTTVRVEHNSPAECDFYFRLRVYGTPSEEFNEWLNKKIESGLAEKERELHF